MKISDVINKLEKLKKAHGDINVVTGQYTGCNHTPAFVSLEIITVKKNPKVKAKLTDVVVYAGLGQAIGRNLDERDIFNF